MQSISFASIEPKRSHLLDELWKYQNKFGFISDEAVLKLAKEYDISDIELEGVISFYHFLHRRYTGKYTIYLNNSIVSEIKGFQRIKEAFERETNTPFGTVDRTGTFGLFLTPCIGLSDQEPACLINFYPFTHLNALKVKEIIHRLKNGEAPADFCDHPDDNIRFTPPGGRSIFFRDYTPGMAISEMKKMTPEGVIDLLKQSELSGRGGAFYPTGMKWDACRKQSAQPKFVVCNADEGEPGTFKDRVLMNNQPGSLVEGMIIAGHTIGASYGVIYLRGEYAWLKPRLEETLTTFRNLGLLGQNAAGIPGFDFDIRIQLGAGAYVCGEETALLESMEGKRGEPRTKWYFPVERGYLQLPTLINNVETLCAVSRILEMGLPAYLRRGIPGSPGTKLISVSGDCKKPGIYEIEWGTSVNELLNLCEAADPYYMQVSGPSGEPISADEIHRKFSMIDLLARKDIRCGGSFMIFNSHRDIIRILLNFSSFFKHESCGICTPCRAGNFIFQRKLLKFLNGLAHESDLEELKQWGAIMKTASRCGLGKTASNSLVMAIDKFHSDFRKRLDQKDDGLIEAFDLEKAVADYEKYKS